MTRSETQKARRSNNKIMVELEPGDKGLVASPATRGFFSTTYDASTSLRLPRKILTRFGAKSFFLTHDVMKDEV